MVSSSPNVFKVVEVTPQSYHALSSVRNSLGTRLFSPQHLLLSAVMWGMPGDLNWTLGGTILL